MSDKYRRLRCQPFDRRHRTLEGQSKTALFENLSSRGLSSVSGTSPALQKLDMVR